MHKMRNTLLSHAIKRASRSWTIAFELLLLRYPELMLIPCGKAITLARQTKLGDTLCRDGYHLNYVYGRYTAACVWYELLTGKDCRRNPYKNADMTKKQKRLTQQSAHRALSAE